MKKPGRFLQLPFLCSYVCSHAHGGIPNTFTLLLSTLTKNGLKQSTPADENGASMGVTLGPQAGGVCGIQ